MSGLDVDPAAAQAGRHAALLLRTWRAISEESDLRRLLAIVCEAAAPTVPFDGLVLVGHIGAEGRPRAMHFAAPEAGTPPHRKSVLVLSRPAEAYEGSELTRQVRAGRAYLCPDLLARPRWLAHEQRMAEAGVRSYATMPLQVRGALVGAATFVRRRLHPFSPEEQATLEELARPLAVALDGALTADRLRLIGSSAGPGIQPRAMAATGASPDVPGPLPGPVGRSSGWLKVMAAVDEVAPTEVTVLVTGETGTGKEQVVDALHRRSRRAQGPLVAVHCGAIPESLIAAELFGHERGAFTGAGGRRKGRFEQAQGGTLFLDEVGELAPAVQVMLLRVLQERTVERLGGGEPVAVDVRVVAATNRDLLAEVHAGRFRSDLYYRLDVFPIHLGPLRERRSDIAPLAEHFIAKHGGGRAVEGIAPETMAALEAHDWPGNVRELENAIQRALVRWRGGPLRLAGELTRQAPAAAGVGAVGAGAADLRVKERRAIEAALAASRGKVSGAGGAAGRFGVPASTLESRIRRLGIDKYRFRSGR
jgi:formate hydrogenlyase transcriptional activator